MSLPTTLVLRPVLATGASATPLGYREIERLEGFEDPTSFLAAVDAALRHDPKAAKTYCSSWRRKKGPGHRDLLSCATAALRGPDGAAAAAWLEPRVTGKVPAAARPAARDAARALQRYWLRVRGDAARCADVAARTRALAADAPAAQPGFVYWHALCLTRAGRPDQALAVLEAYVAAAGAAPKARAAAQLLAADLLVHEHLAPARARELLGAVQRAEPANDEAFYLAARLMRDTKRLAAAHSLIARARRLAPKKALYRHFQESLRREPHPER